MKPWIYLGAALCVVAAGIVFEVQPRASRLSGAETEGTAVETAGENGEAGLDTDFAVPAAEDPGFQDFVKVEQVAAAWNQLDAELLTDLALRLSAAERVLRRSHKSLSAESLMKAAARIAAHKKDTRSLERLLGEAKDTGRKEIETHIASLKQLSAGSRAAGPLTNLDVDNATLEAVAQLSAITGAIDNAQLTGKVEYLDGIEEHLASFSDLTPEWVEKARKAIAASRKELASQDRQGDDALQVLDQLSGGARGDLPTSPTWNRLTQLNAAVLALQAKIAGIERQLKAQGAKAPQSLHQALQQARAELARLNSEIVRLKRELARH